MPNRKRTSKKREPKPYVKFLNRYGSDLTILPLFVAGIYLLVEKRKISRDIFEFLGALFSKIGHVIYVVFRAIYDWFARTETSDVVGYLLIFLALFAIMNKIRRHTVQNYPNTKECPNCQSELNRMHRKPIHKFLGRILFLRFKQYRCTNRECHWKGIQINYL